MNYHITVDGPKKCQATINNCKYGEHFKNYSSALQYYEKSLSSEMKRIPTPLNKAYVLHSPNHGEENIYDRDGLPHGVNVDNIPSNSIVFPRNRAIPFGELLESEVELLGSRLVNSYEQHRFISDSKNWRGLLRHGIHHWTEDDLNNLSDEDGPFFIKGETNALKNEWEKYCYAVNKNDLINVVKNNRNHPLLQNQKIIIQPFMSFKKLGVNSSNGQPVINEWRYFCLNGEIMECGFYWSKQKVDGAFSNDGADPIVMDTLEDIESKANFVAVDVGQLHNGEWKVIELNDGNMAGLCGVDGDSLWGKIKEKLNLLEK